MTAAGEHRLDAWFREVISEYTGTASKAVDLGSRFRELGLTSLHITRLASRLSDEIGHKILPTAAWQYPTPRALVRYALSLIRAEELGSKKDESQRQTHERLSDPIAIVGMGCRFPGDVNSPDDLWTMLCGAHNGICEVPSERWNANDYFDEDVTRPNKMTTRWGGFVKRVDKFDASFFEISPREARQMDPQQRLTLEVAWEALEDAGIDYNHLRGTATGVFLGSMWSDYARLVAAEPGVIDSHTATGQDTSIISARVSYFLDLRGASVTVNTASSSSAVAVHLACESLRNGHSRMALAGGVHLITSPQSTVTMTKFGAMNPAGECRAFDANANGYVRGEGVGIVVLKRLSQAIAEGDRVYCLICDSAVNNDGYSNGLTAPNPEAQQAVIRDACFAALVDHATIDYIETHGPGTILGDPIEAEAIGAVFSASHSYERPLRIGSIKTNIGHTEAAAGIAGLMKTALCLYHRTLVPNLHFAQPNPYIDFDRLHLRVQTELESWPWNGERPRAGVSSFGFGGTNCHIVLEAASRNAAILPISADSSKKFRQKLLSALGLFSKAIGGSQAAALSKKLAERDCGGLYRTALAVEDAGGVFEALSSRLRSLTTGKLGDQRPQLVFVCPGHGTQWLGMARSLLSREPVFRGKIFACDRLIREQSGWSLIDELLTDANRSRLQEHDVAQLAIFSMTVALGELWQSWAIRPDAYVGHSMGEIAACVLGGVLSLEEGVRIVEVRARLMRAEASGRGGILLVTLPDGDVERAVQLSDGLTIAGYNSPSTILLSGSIEAIQRAEDKFREHSIETHRAKVDVASHSAAIDPIVDILRQELQSLSPQPAQTPIRSTVRDVWLSGRECGPDYWADNLRQPVRFYQAIEVLASERGAAFVELSPHPILIEAIKQTVGKKEHKYWALASCWRDEDERSCLFRTLADLYELGFDVDWGAVYGGVSTDPLRDIRVEDIEEEFQCTCTA